MPVAACITFEVRPILRPTRRRPAARFLSRHTPWMAYESSTVASGYRALTRGITPRARSAPASSSAIAAMVSAGSILGLLCRGHGGASAKRLQLMAELVLPPLPARQLLPVALAGVGEAVGADRDRQLRGVRAGDDGLRVAVEVEDQGCVGVPARHDGVAPPVAALVVVHVPGDDRVVGVAGVVVLRVDLDAVAVRIAQVQVERVRHPVAARAALDRVGAAQRAELVADRDRKSTRL